MQSQMAAQAQQNTEMMRQWNLNQQQQLALQLRGVDQQEASSVKSMARTSAGPAPSFHGKMNDIEIHRWCSAIAGWFETAQIISDQEKLGMIGSIMKDSAQAWWAAEKESKRADTITTWELFTIAITKHFLPMDVDRYAREKISELTLRSSNQDIIKYTSAFNELNQLVGNRDELDRILTYQAGLPEEYRAKSIEKRHNKLTTAQESAMALFKAKASSRIQGKTASVHQMETEGSSNYSPSPPASSNSSDTGEPSYATDGGAPGGMMQHYVMRSLEEKVEQLTRIVEQQAYAGGFNSSNNHRGGYRNDNSYRGGRRERGNSNGYQGNRGGQTRGGQQNNSRSRSPGTSLASMGISRELIENRKAANQCLKCGKEGHYVGVCRSAAKTIN